MIFFFSVHVHVWRLESKATTNAVLQELPTCLFLYIHLYCKWAFVFWWACAESIGQLQAQFSPTYHMCPRKQAQAARLSEEPLPAEPSPVLLCFLRWPLTSSWNLQIKLDGPANKPQGSPCLYHSRSRITNTCYLHLRSSCLHTCTLPFCVFLKTVNLNLFNKHKHSFHLSIEQRLSTQPGLF